MLKATFLYLITLAFFCHAYPAELPRGGFFTGAGVFYWQAQEGGLSYAIKGSDLARVKNPRFEWDVGFNVGIGYRIPHDLWQLLLQFTSFQTHSDAFTKDKVLFPVWLSSHQTTSLFANEIKAHWRLHLGLIDLLLSKPYLATPTLTLTPEAGIRWGSARQKFNLEYRGGNFPEEITLRMKNKFQGIGPFGGLISQYALGKGFRLLAKGAASLLYGEFYLHQDEDTDEEKLLGLHSIFRSTAPILEASAGLRWERFFASSLRRLTLDLTWDQYLFFSQNQLIHFLDSANQGDLSIAGIHFSFLFDF